MNNDEFFFENFESKIVLTNDFMKDDDIELSIPFKKFVLDSIFNREIYDIKRAW